jgi:hypothetical protein
MMELRRKIRDLILTVQAFRSQKMTSQVPLFVILVLLSILVVFIKTMAPLAPFVYSLF